MVAKKDLLTRDLAEYIYEKDGKVIIDSKNTRKVSEYIVQNYTNLYCAQTVDLQNRRLFWVKSTRNHKVMFAAFIE